MARYNLADINPTPQSFGLTSAVYRSQTLGVELLAHNGHRLSVGVSDPGSMVAGELTLMAATGRSPALSGRFKPSQSCTLEKGCHGRPTCD